MRISQKQIEDYISVSSKTSGKRQSLLSRASNKILNSKIQGENQISVLNRQSILDFHRQQNEQSKKTDEEQPSLTISMSVADDGQDRSQQVVTAFYSPSMNAKKSKNDEEEESQQILNAIKEEKDDEVDKRKS